MKKCIKDLEKNFDEGLLRMNWTALSIPDYGVSLNEVLAKFEGVVAHVNKIAKDIRYRILEMKEHRLFNEPPYKKLGLPILDCWVRFSYLNESFN